MAFPLTHLCVAQKILNSSNEKNEKNISQFLLGSIAPDAIHYREEFQGAVKKNIGAAKKITHLCPESDEKWGQVTDNDGWIERVKKFFTQSVQRNDFFAKGYAAHILADIYNNKTLWHNFRTNYPAEAAKGYNSDYYADLRNIDARLYRDFPDIPKIMSALENSVPDEIAGLVSANEVAAIKNNLLYEHCKNIPPDPPQNYFFVSYDDTIEFIENAAKWIEVLL
jgi:hypothetical protein